MSRDIDLQAILDAPDSDSSEPESDIIDELPFFDKGLFRPSLTEKSKSKNSSSSKYKSNIDLEKILMEHDYEDDEEYDTVGHGGHTYDDKRGIDASALLRRYEFSSANDDNFSLGESTIPTLPSQFVMGAPRSPLRKKATALGDDSNKYNDGTPTKGFMSTEHEEFQSEKKDEHLSHTAGLSDVPTLMEQAEALTETYSPSRFLKKSAVYDMPRLSTFDKNKSLDIEKKKRGESLTPRKSSQENNDYSYTSSYRNPEEWAVLQSILNDDDDNDASFEMLSSSENIMNDMSKEASDSKNFDPSRRKISRAESNASSTVDVDAILYSMDDDSDDDANLAELDEMIARFSLKNYASNRKSSMEQKINAGGNMNLTSNEQKNIKSQTVPSPPTSGVRTQVVTDKETKIDRAKLPLSNGKIKKYRHQHNISQLSASDTLTEAALKHAEDYERRLLRPGQRDIVSPLMVKRRMKPKIELETKSRSKQQQNSKKKAGNQFSQHNEGFNFSGMIETKPMQRIGAELTEYSQFQKDAIGLPTALSIGSKFIAIGTQRGIILVFDLFEELRQKLGLPTSGSNDATSLAVKKFGSVSSIDLSANGENLVAGYTSGCIALWDVIKGTIVKSVPDMHPSPITSLRFISEKSLSFVSVDAGGLVNKVSFTKPLLWTTYNVESECLLDGTAGQILAFSSLPPMSSLKYVPMNNTDDKKQPYHQSVNQIVLIALSSARSSFAIAVEPSVSVLHRWSKPPVEQMNIEAFIPAKDDESQIIESNNDPHSPSSPPDIFLPCLAWNWAIVSGGEHSVTPILARGWGCSIQFLRASYPSYEESDRNDDTVHWPIFGVHDEFQATAPVVAMMWLGNRSLLYLTLTNELTVVDTVMMTLMERLDFSGIKLVYAEFALSRNATTHPNSNDEFDNVVSTTFQNSIRSSEDRVLVLCQEELKSLSIIGMQQRITTLEQDGEWLEALALALDHYESTVKSQEDRKRDPDGKDNIMNHPEFISKIRKSADEEWIADLLLRYLNLAVENAPESTTDDSMAFGRSSDKRQSNSRIDLAQSHFQMLAGVCIEFCIMTRRPDLLFNDVYDRFRDSGYTAVFLDVLEPYVLNDKLQYIAPEVMSQFVEHCKVTNDVSTVERCLLHMDVTIMDFDSILTLLRKNAMYSALIHVYTHGLNDYISPLETLFEAIFDAAATDFNKQRRLDGAPRTAFERYGYKAILYLRHCFTNRTFPLGQELKPENRVDTLRPEILRFLKLQKYVPPSRRQRSESLTGFREHKYPYLRVLMMVDAKAFLDALSLVFDAPEIRFIESTDNQDNMEDWHGMIERNITAATIEESSSDVGLDSESFEEKRENEMKITCPDRMDFARILSSILASLESIDATFGDVDQFHVTKNAFYDFMAKYLLKGVLRAPPHLIVSVISRMASRFAEDDIIKLLQILPRNAYNREKVLRVVENEGMTRAALVLYKTGVVELFEGVCKNDTGAQYFMKVIECFLKDKDVKFQLEAFDYVKKECIGGSTFRSDGDERTVHDVLRNALCKKLCALVNLDPVLSAQIVAEIYIEELETILKALEKAEEGMVQFKFFHAIISGALTKIDVVAGPVLLAHLTVDHHQQYLELMARFHPEMVYQHLITHDNYRAEECLHLCQEHEIADASAYLLEKMGNVSSALQLMLQTLEGRMMILKRVVRGLSTSSSYPNPSKKIIRRNLVRKTPPGAYHDIKETQSVRQILTVALDLCERNSSSSSNKSGHGSQLWFNVLDRLINAKGFLRLSKELPEHSEIMLNVLSNLLKMTMQRMVSNVALPDLVRKITTDHSGNRLGEFREMISTMLSTYVSELEICSSAVDVMNDDVCKLLAMKFSLKMRGAKINNINGISLSSPTENQNALRKLPQGSVLSVNTGNATTTSMGESMSELNKTQEQNSALNRLKAKRQKTQTKSQRHNKRSQIQIGMMTFSDKLYANGESSDAAYMPRYVGSLSDAEHYGRLQ
jgi:hypothetical protein